MDAFRQKLDLEKMIREQILDGKDFVFSIPFTRQGVCKKPSAEIPNKKGIVCLSFGPNIVLKRSYSKQRVISPPGRLNLM